MNPILRKLSIVAALLIIIGAAFGTQIFINKKKPPERKGPTKELAKEIEIFSVKNIAVASSLPIQGRLAAFDKVDLFAEVSGMLKSTPKPFKVGTYFSKGEVMLQLDNEEARLSLLSQKSSLMNAITQLMPDLKIDYPASFDHWKNYLERFEPNQALKPFPAPINDQEKFFIASRNLETQYYNIKSAETRLGKYTLYAPFSGVLTQANVTPGALIRVGQNLGNLMNTGNYELETTVSLADLNYIKLGNTVELHSEDIEGTWSGKVKRISDQIDPATQSVIVFIGVNGKNLREGMYLRGSIAASSIQNAVEIPRKLLINQEAVYTFRDSVLVLQPVEVVKIEEDSAIVRGLIDGTFLLKEVFTGAFDGMKVRERQGLDSPKATNGLSPQTSASESPKQ